MRTSADKRHFWLRKIHSLTGFIPIGLYMLVHVFGENASIRFFDKGTGFNTVAAFFGGAPLYILGAIEAVLVLSILFHAIYGLFIVADARPNLTRYGLGRNWNYFIQRVTGVIAFVFIGYHVYTTRFTVYMGMLGWAPKAEVSAHWMATNIFGHGPFVIALYAIGVVSAVYHFFNGVWNGLISWGITVGPKAQKVSALVCTTIGVLASAFSLWVLWGFQPFLQAGA